MAGRCIPGKGHDLLIQAVLALKNRFEFETHIWGMDQSGKGAVYAQQLHDQLSAAGDGVQNKVHFQPFRHDMENFYRAMDIVVVPSRNTEGLPRMALEAMAWGKPTVVAGHSGLIEVVDHGRTGLVFRSGDWRSLAEQLQRLLATEILRCQLREAARAEVARRFSVQGHADAVQAVYRNVLSGRCQA
jgi:glycosyltransferase involved in cell wall biosynthesis